jgi:DNA/RNA-binding domain of Phe-tRNA-synthetase-like protein
MEPRLNISEEIRQTWPKTVIGSITARIVVTESPEKLKEKLIQAAREKRENLEINDISQLPPIKQGRKAYKAFGKDPARYRLASEALLRRILKGKEMYFVNNLVEINNLVSIESGFPICAFDLEKVNNPITFRIGKTDEPYQGIGRGTLNIENLPVFSDSEGAFGSPTSDSERVKITKETRWLNMNIVSFSGQENLEYYLEKLKKYLEEFAEAEEVENEITG